MTDFVTDVPVWNQNECFQLQALTIFKVQINYKYFYKNVSICQYLSVVSRCP
jgi:hypothetical protein